MVRLVLKLERDPAWDSKGLDDDIRGLPLKLGREIKKTWSFDFDNVGVGFQKALSIQNKQYRAILLGQSLRHLMEEVEEVDDTVQMQEFDFHSEK